MGFALTPLYLERSSDLAFCFSEISLGREGPAVGNLSLVARREAWVFARRRKENYYNRHYNPFRPCRIFVRA